MSEEKVKKLFQESISGKRTSIILKKLVFSAVEAVLLKHYPDSYSTRCLQSSIAISSLLNRYGINSKHFVGALCVSQAFENNIPPSWNGFWGNEHHVWVCNGFGEFIDLTVKYLHAHPMSKKYNQIPMHAIWWEDTLRWPRILKYLHQGPVAEKLTEPETRDLECFKEEVLEEWFGLIKYLDRQDIEFSPILENTHTINLLHEQGDPWLIGSMPLEEYQVPLPAWIVNREKELMDAYLKKT